MNKDFVVVKDLNNTGVKTRGVYRYEVIDGDEEIMENRETYYDWLLNKIYSKKRPYLIVDWNSVLESLHKIPFTWPEEFDLDEDRAMDAMAMRDQFRDDHPYDMRDDDFPFDGAVSVLEVLVALGERVDVQLLGEDNLVNGLPFFWTMLWNLQIDQFDEFYQVKNIVMKWLLRNYSYDGVGSIFPVIRDTYDHRQLDIWAQLQRYIIAFKLY